MDAPYPRHGLRPRNVAAAERRRQRAYQRAIEALELEEADLLALRHPAEKPRRTHWTVALLNVICGFTIALVVWLLLGPYLLGMFAPPAPSVAPAVPTMRPVAPPAAAPAAEQAPAAPVAEAQPAPVAVEAPVVALPTAAIAIAAQPEVVTVPDAAPLRYAPGSGPAPTAAPAPTVATTAFMQIGKDYEANADGTCVRTRRDGALVEFCQIRPMNIGEMSSVADFLRTGRIPGEKVK